MGCLPQSPTVNAECRKAGFNGPPPLLVEGRTSTFVLVSPLGDCEVPLAKRRVTIELLNEQGELVRVPEASLAMNAQSLTEATLQLTLTPGIYQLRVVFEPSLGTVNQQLAVAKDLTDAGTIMRGPSLCQQGPYRLGPTFVCVTDGQILTIHNDEAEPLRTWEPMPDTAVVVVGDVMWAFGSGHISRFFVSDAGQIQLTNHALDETSLLGDFGQDYAIVKNLLLPAVDGGLERVQVPVTPHWWALHQPDAGFYSIVPGPFVCPPADGGCWGLTPGNIWSIRPEALVLVEEGGVFDLRGLAVPATTISVLPRPLCKDGPRHSLTLSTPLRLFTGGDLPFGNGLVAAWGGGIGEPLGPIIAAKLESGRLRFYFLGTGDVRGWQPDAVTLMFGIGDLRRVVPLE